MFVFLLTTAAALVVQTAPAITPAPAATLMGYDDVVRCAGVTQAASELEGGESSDGTRLFDAALYWSLTATQAAQAAGRDAVSSDREQTLARIEAVRRFGIGDAEVRALLQRCRERTPDLG